MRVTWLLILASCAARAVAAQPAAGERAIVVDDFESDAEGGLPHLWRSLHNNRFVPLTPDLMHPNEKFYVVRENDNQSLRAYSNGESVSIMMGNGGDGFDWSLSEFPGLSWDWRAEKLPENAREDVERLNDSGAAVYVIFAMEGFIVKRPRSIKYVYSSTLPVGTEISYGKLAVIVASSALEGIGNWVHVERDVRADYARVFGGRPPDRPIYLRLWSDSDNTDSPAEADFDNITFLRDR